MRNTRRIAAERKPIVGTTASNLVLSQLRGNALVSPGVIENRRQGRERRRLTVWSVIYGGFRPRRRSLRRHHDHALPLVDWHDSQLLAVSIGILLLCFADAFLTLNLLMLGAEEVNPLMARLIYADVTTFVAVKMALTGLGVLTLVLLSRFRLFGRIKVAQSLHGILAGYTVLVVYELHLFFG